MAGVLVMIDGCRDGVAALIASQNVEPVEGSDGPNGLWQFVQKVAPRPRDLTVDPDARLAHTTVRRRPGGSKAHIVVEPDTGMITDCALTQASGSDSHEAVVGLALLADEYAPPSTRSGSPPVEPQSLNSTAIHALYARSAPPQYVGASSPSATMNIICAWHGHGAHTAMASRVPPAPTYDRTLDRVADPQQPQSPLPRRDQKRLLATPPHRTCFACAQWA